MMEGLQNLILPQSPEHILLLNILLLINLIVFLPYLSILWGNLILSAYYRYCCESNSTKVYLARELMQFMRDKRFFGYIFSVFPPLGLLTIFAQLLSEIKTDIYPLFVWASILLFLGQFFVFRFQNSIVKENPNIGKGNRFFLAAAIIFISLGVWFLFSAYYGIIEISTTTENQSLLEYGFSISTISRVIVYFVLSLALSSAFGIFRLYRTENSNERLRTDGVKILAKTALINIAILPLWSIIAFTTIPGIALSYSVFALLSISIFLAIILAITYYSLSSEPNARTGIYTFYLFMITVAIIFSSDHMIIHNSTYFAIEKLYAKATLKEEKNTEISPGLLSEEEQLALGETIFNTTCFACHQFDKRLVGPPYNDVLPKYINAPEKMKEYILNPRRIREDYPPMPAQPLKPKEADAIVVYLLKIVKEQN